MMCRFTDELLAQLYPAPLSILRDGQLYPAPSIRRFVHYLSPKENISPA